MDDINTTSGEHLDTAGNQENQRYVQLTNDLLFHMVFSMSKEARKDLVSTILGIPASEINNVELVNPIQYNGSIDTKETILDLRIHLNNNTLILVEMQVRNFKFWTNRTLIYGCRNIDFQTDGKDAYVQLEPVIQVSIMNYTLFPDHKVFFDVYKIQDDDHQVFTDKLKFIILDLTAVSEATEEDKQRGLVQWAEAFNAGNWETISKIERPGIKEAVKTMEGIMANPVQRDLIWNRHLALMDYNSELIGAREDGLEEGQDLAYRKTAKAMKAEGIDLNVIERVTGLSLSEIAAL